MADTNKIFRSLQQYTVPPPRGLYARIWKKIKALSKGNEQLPVKITIPDKTTGAQPGVTTEENIWSGLQSYIDKEATPPPFDFQTIRKALSDNKDKKVSPKKRTAYFWFYSTAAAAAISGIIFFIYTNTAKPDTRRPVSAGNNKQIPSAGTSATMPAAVIAANRQKVSSGSQPGRNVITHGYSKAPVRRSTTATANNGILNNDFLYTLTNFNLPDADAFFSDMKKNKKISLNSYSYVNVSDKMAAFLKQMYAVNRRKKYTWKARRMRARLNRWKKADEKNFDTEPGKNPLDILDLSEFLFKK